MAVGIKIANGDFIVNDNGSIDFVGPADKCARDFGKMLQTKKEYADNTKSLYRYNSDYGTELDNSAMYRNLSREATRDVIIILLNEAIARYLKLQEGRMDLDIEEIITKVKIDAYYDYYNLSNLILNIKYSTILNEDQTPGLFMQTIG